MNTRRAFALLACSALALAATGCEREARKFHDQPAGAKGGPAVALSDLRPGATPPPAATPGPYDENAWAVGEGQRLYEWFNCIGCHSNGGGGMGPALMDEKWIYGVEPANIYASIIEGRPNGMPAFRGKLTDQQAWQLVSYVRSLSGLLRKDVAPGRADAMSARPAPQATPNPPPTSAP